MPERRGACCCGQLTVICTGEPIRVSVCHCRACKRRTGSAFSNNARFRADAVTLIGRTATFSRTGEEIGRRTSYAFCPDCGATLCYRSDAEPEIVAVPVGSFADPGFPPPTRSFYHRTRRNPWVEIAAAPLECID
jgi:hypothetical protein